MRVVHIVVHTNVFDPGQLPFSGTSRAATLRCLGLILAVWLWWPQGSWMLEQRRELGGGWVGG